MVQETLIEIKAKMELDFKSYRQQWKIKLPSLHEVSEILSSILLLITPLNCVAETDQPAFLPLFPALPTCSLYLTSCRFLRASYEHEVFCRTPWSLQSLLLCLLTPVLAVQPNPWKLLNEWKSPACDQEYPDLSHTGVWDPAQPVSRWLTLGKRFSELHFSHLLNGYNNEVTWDDAWMALGTQCQLLPLFSIWFNTI